ncbi:hypothetical protein GCM10011571_10670 [Marinithermofilum abyssi]|uniref:Uncharacterized protein n=1 Tax=Marinithermofilum abyssi TaxID=1571185 RepID=A0A8J2YDJ5_9BACL|nr:hypothetical protein [Marinithermofilum abyssi]GGE11222.1 hypothetical protein GCM10011571_10670 [Marinithermofilum abyssi]
MLGITIGQAILAVISTNKEKVAGGVPIFQASDNEELQHTAFSLEKILDGMTHQLDEETMIIVRHQ